MWAGAGVVFANLESAASPTSPGSDLAGHTRRTAVESPVRNRTFRTREITRKLAGSPNCRADPGGESPNFFFQKEIRLRNAGVVSIFPGISTLGPSTLHYVI